MAKLVDFYLQHKRLFLAQKHQNEKTTEKVKDAVVIKFLTYCESQKIYHTAGIKKQTAYNFFHTQEMKTRSPETQRKYFLVVRKIYKNFLRINLRKEDFL